MGSLTEWRRLIARSYYADVPVFLSSLDDRKLDRAVRIPCAGELAARYGEVRPTVVRDSLVQVTMHSAYHRGQVNVRIRALGGEPPLTDFIVWIWRGRPRAEWPAEAEAFGS